jgi:hypothetical protein
MSEKKPPGPINDNHRTIGSFKSTQAFINIVKGKDRVTKKSTRHAELHTSAGKVRLITSIPDDWDDEKLKAHLQSTHGEKLNGVNWFLNPVDKIKDIMKEEVAANAVGGGAVAGIGVGPSGEPGVLKARSRATVILKARTMKRFKDAIRGS